MIHLLRSWLTLLPVVVCCTHPALSVAQETPAADANLADEQTEPAETTGETDVPSMQVRLEFREQPWPEVLQWLAEKSELNLDWQELPEGNLNLSSNSNYTLQEAHDLINMQLLARGFTLLARGEVLRVAKLDDLDPTMVPRVEPEELDTLQPHQVVRVSFSMDWLIAEEAVDEFKPLLSPYGKLYAMASTNRLEAVDVVINLRSLNELLVQAERDEGRRERVMEFHLQHRKAAQLAPKVRELLGLPPEPSRGRLPTELDIEQTKFRSEAIKQLGEDARPLIEEQPDIHLVVNEEENSILIHARADKLEIAGQAIEALDKPLPERQSPWENASRVKTYPVDNFDPQTVTRVVDAMRSSGSLDDETRVDYEESFNRLIVLASPEDQLAISNLIRNFSGETRGAEVIPLATLEPDYAARAVETVLKNPSRPDKIPGTASNGSFQIEPDVSNHRLLLWATPEETAEVRRFLVQLGETFVDQTLQQKLHVVPTRGVGLAAIQGQIQDLWQEVSDAPLVIESTEEAQPATSAPDGERSSDAPADEVPPAGQEQDDERGDEEEPTANETEDESLTRMLTVATQSTPTVDRAAASDEAASAPTDNGSGELPSRGPAVKLLERPDGRLVISSDDPQAAAAARALIEGLLPPVGAVQMLELRYADADDVRDHVDSILDQQEPASSSALAPRPRHSIDVDERTNSLILQNVSSEQLELIKQVVKTLDRPPEEDEDLRRVQRIYEVRNTEAETLAETVKEVYRDLLSRSDKAFSNNNRRRSLGYDSNGDPRDPQYQGLLSVSGDNESNSLIISAPQYLIDEVMELVEKLDGGPPNSSVGVVPLSPNVDPESVMDALDEVLEEDSGRRRWRRR